MVSWMYLKHGHYGPQEGVEVFTVATRRLVAGFATKFASEQVHAQNAVADLVISVRNRMEKFNKSKKKDNKKIAGKKEKKEETIRNTNVNNI